MIIVDTYLFAYDWESLGIKKLWADLFPEIERRFPTVALVRRGTAERVKAYLDPQRTFEVDCGHDLVRQARDLDALLELNDDLGSRFQYEIAQLTRAFQACGGSLFLSTHSSYVAGPSAMIVHDLMDEQQRGILMTRKMHCITNADYLWCVSETTRAALEAVVDLRGKRIDVIYNGIGAETRWHDPAVFRAQFALTRPYFVMIGSDAPHKNRARMIEACQEFPEFDIVMVGEVQAVARQGRVLCIPRTLPQPLLLSALSGASVLLHASLIEGFGYPLVEAQAVGTPVVTSWLSCMPEIAGTGAAYCNPYDSADIARAVRVALDQRERLAAAGLQNCRRFALSTMREHYLQGITDILADLQKAGGHGYGALKENG